MFMDMRGIEVRRCLSKFKQWIDQFKILNPLESDSILRNAYFNATGEVFWIDFKDPLFSCCAVQEKNIFIDIFDFYFSYAGTNIKIINCDFNQIISTYATLKDLSNLKFLSKLGMISIMKEDISNSGLVRIKFTLQERIFQNGSI